MNSPPRQSLALRFVVLHHRGIASPHFDLMIEPSEGAKLMTWRLSDWPMAGGNATRIADHRNAYLQYEGEIAGGRGTVACVARGTAQIIDRSSKNWIIRAGEFELSLPSNMGCDE